MVWCPSFQSSVRADGVREYRVGHELVDEFLEFASGRARPRFYQPGHRLAERITARIDDRQIMRRYGLGAAPRRFCTPGWHPLSAVRDKISIPYRPPY